MEAITTHAMLLVEFIGNRIHIGVVGHGLVESGIEDTHLRQIGQQGLNGIDTFDVGWIVQRRKVVASLEIAHDLGGEEDALRELLAAMHHAMAYGIEFVEVFQHGMFALGEELEDKLHASGVLGNRSFELEFLAIGLIFDKGIRQTDFLDTTRGDDRLVGHVIKSVFYTAASAVENKDFHIF